MSKCLRCGAGGEWIQGDVPRQARDDEVVNLRAELARLRGAAEDVVDADWAIVSAGRATGAYNRHMAPAVQALAAALQQQPAIRGEEKP